MQRHSFMPFQAALLALQKLATNVTPEKPDAIFPGIFCIVLPLA
jgi:hypothetical protein